MRRFYDLVFTNDHPLKHLYHKVFYPGDFVVVSGGRKEAKRQAVSAKGEGKIPIAVVSRPQELKEFVWVKELFAIFSKIPVDEPSIHLMREKGIPLGIFYTGTRLSVLRHNIRVALEREVPVIAASGVRDPNLVRSPYDVRSLLKLLGMTEPQALSALSTWWERW